MLAEASQSISILELEDGFFSGPEFEGKTELLGLHKDLSSLHITKMKKPKLAENQSSSGTKSLSSSPCGFTLDFAARFPADRSVTRKTWMVSKMRTAL